MANNKFCYAVKQHFFLVYCGMCVCVVSTFWHIVCCFSLLSCCLVTGIEHSPWSWHRSTTFPSFPRLPSPSRFHLDHSWDYISHGSLEEPRTVPISFVPGLKRQAKPGCARHISAAATQARRLGGWHDVSESRLPSTVPVVSFCHLQEESQMLWHDKAARLGRQSGCMGATKGDGLPPFWLRVRHAINKFLRRNDSRYS